MHFNPAALSILGLSASELTGKTSIDPRWKTTREDESPLPGEEHPSMVSLRTGKPVKKFPMNLELASGEKRRMLVSSEPLTLESGNKYVVVTFSNVTALREAEKSLAVQNERWRLGLKASRIGIWEYDLSSKKIHWDDEMFRLYGADPRYFISSFINWRNCIVAEDRDYFEEQIQNVIYNENFLDIKYRIQTQSGDFRSLRLLAEIVRDSSGFPIRIIGSNTDITRMEHVESLANERRIELEKAIERFELIIEGSSVGIWDWPDIKQKKEYWSPKFYFLLGFEVNEIEASLEAFSDLLHPDDRERTFELVSDHFEGKSRFEIEYRLRTKAGLYRWFWGTGQVSRDSSGSPSRMVGSIQDIHDRKTLEIDIANTKNFIESIVRNSPSINLVSDKDGIITHFNPAAERNLGYLSEEVIGKKRIGDFLLRKSVPAHDGIPQSCRDGDMTATEFENCECNFVRKNGSIFPVERSLVKLLNSNGEFVGFLENSTDISERKKAEIERVQSITHVKESFEAAPNGMMSINENGKIEFANRAIKEMFGFSSGELEGLSVSELLLPNSLGRDEFLRQFIDLKSKKENPNSLISGFASRRNGELFPVEVRQSPMITRDGWFAIVSVVDITERKMNEIEMNKTMSELERSNAELESFAYIASHDLQAPLRHISSYTDLLKEKIDLEQYPEAEKWMNYVLDATQNMKDLIDGLLAFSRVKGLKEYSELIDLNTMVDSLVSTLSVGSPKALISRSELPLIEGSKTQMHQLFQNLIQNAIKFRREGVEQKIEINCESQGEDFLFSVKDNGIGIAPEHFERVFQLCQRLHTKSQYVGTGIGLSICKKIVSLYKGEIWIESVLGNGCTFWFTIRKKYNESQSMKTL